MKTFCFCQQFVQVPPGCGIPAEQAAAEFRARGGEIIVESDQKTFVYNVYDEYKPKLGDSSGNK